MVALACEVLLNELILHFDDSDEAVLKRIKGMVELILARCRQSGATLKGLVGAVLGISPTKEKHTFIDIHAEA